MYTDVNSTVFKLATAERDDLDCVAQLYRAACGTPGCTWNEFYPTYEDAASDLAAGCLYVYRGFGEIVGAVSVVPENELDALECWRVREGNIKEIARVTIAPEYRGRGLAVRMLSELMALLCSERCTGGPPACGKVQSGGTQNV